MGNIARFVNQWGRFFASIVLPTMTAVLLTLCAIYLVIIPAFEKSFLDGKKDAIRELTKAAWSVIEYYETQETNGNLSREEAQRKTLNVLKTIRYGERNQDYFWVTDSRPSLIMHPYSEDLIGVDLSGFKDPQGKPIFLEIKKTVEQMESGFLNYSWKKYAEDQTVPKLSYVQRFPQWNWVVGTGVFLDDVDRKMGVIRGRLSRLSLLVVSLLTILLLYIGRQSYLFERQRNLAQMELSRSRIKYKNLVETVTEPILMFFRGNCIYSNRSVETILGRGRKELAGATPASLFQTKTKDDKLPFEAEGALLEGSFPGIELKTSSGPVETDLSISTMDLNGQMAAVINVKDLRSTRKIEKERDESRERYRKLSTRLNMGIFRVKVEPRLPLMEANGAFYTLLNLTSNDEEISLQDLFRKNNVSVKLFEKVMEKGYVKDEIVLLPETQGVKCLSLSLALVHDEDGVPYFYDGLIEDVSDKVRREKDRERLIVELQTSLHYLNQPVAHVKGEYLCCDRLTPIDSAAKKMKAARCSSLLVMDAEGREVGILTDMAIREKVVARALDYQTPVAEVMSTPLIYIDENALIFEAIQRMEDEGIKHLVVNSGGNRVTKVIANEDLLSVHRYSSTTLIQEIEESRTVEEIVAAHTRLPRIVKALVDSGAHVRNITRITGRVSEAVLVHFIQLAIDDMGEPPAPFAFICVGSEGREEQTLATDQDNAIIYQGKEGESEQEYQDYFLTLSKQVCTWLDRAGYNFCKGDVMAMNVKWCQPLHVWKGYFSTWIVEAKPEDLLDASIFFDLRCMYGEEYLVGQLRKHIFTQVANRDAFFYHLAQNALLFRLPVDFFGNISLESGGEHPETFNIKHIIALITGYARIYAINFSFDEANTLLRLDRLKLQGFLSDELHQDITEAYNYLMQLRFTHQVECLDNNREPDNHISLDELSYMDRTILKKIFSQLAKLQNKLNSIGKVELFF